MEMREILFKAKHLSNGEWVEGYYLKYIKPLNGEIEHRIFISDGDGVTWYAVHGDTICQYTGLTDKNGNKIWENDVIEIPSEDENFKLEWDDDAARFAMVGDGLTVDFDNYWSYDVEVTGNIFDNPELLEMNRWKG